ncbi:hypothetical protein JANAI62_10670 [Jannaschia pagri]|uniref:DUF1697 domain-containing protein n=1 Tax=Jannaschia pagri TaxID=2829797 RepID=A0ABQ4NJ56_9RHOB|nr:MULTISPECIES: DUF1697 domain-containing protein [unclassified Jannaschia]GIT90612.1 hypothetical protein JANAI61_10700 [Jannaschia sp. AI_61]GIT94444.1 hypothetical protein JANAI62_10670 [Jannaschia sp. AI_62]
MVGADLRVILLAGIGAATHKKMRLADLCDAIARHGVMAPRSLLSTGNILCRSDMASADLAAMVQQTMAEFGVDRRAFVLDHGDLARIARDNPFPDALDRANHLLIHVTDGAPEQPAWPGPERIAVRGRVAFVDYIDGIGRSRLTGPKLTRLLGRPGTARNWTTWQKLISAGLGH